MKIADDRVEMCSFFKQAHKTMAEGFRAFFQPYYFFDDINGGWTLITEDEATLLLDNLDDFINLNPIYWTNRNLN